MKYTDLHERENKPFSEETTSKIQSLRVWTRQFFIDNSSELKRNLNIKYTISFNNFIQIIYNFSFFHEFDLKYFLILKIIFERISKNIINILT